MAEQIKQGPMSTPTKPATQTAPAATTTMEKARAGRKAVPKNETQEQTFKRLVEPRVTKLLKTVKQLKSLARFKPTEAQRVKVFTAVAESLKAAEISWKASTEKLAEEGFKI
jgi:hypothetical protein